MRLIDADELKKLFPDNGEGSWTYNITAKMYIDNAPTVKPQRDVTIPHELIEKLVLCVVDTVENIDWDNAIEAYNERPQDEDFTKEKHSLYRRIEELNCENSRLRYLLYKSNLSSIYGSTAEGRNNENSNQDTV